MSTTSLINCKENIVMILGSFSTIFTAYDNEILLNDLSIQKFSRIKKVLKTKMFFNEFHQKFSIALPEVYFMN